MNNATTHLADFTEGVNKDHIPKYYGEALCNLASSDESVVALCADVAPPTESDLFKNIFPDRFYMTGIAEANTIGLASGMARMGDIPFVHSFCVFITRRAFDQIAMQIAYPKTNVKLIGFLPGITTALGVSHQAIDDIALMRALPNMCVIEPSGPEQIDSVINQIYKFNGPVYVRQNRANRFYDKNELKDFEIGKCYIEKKGKDIAIFSCGLMVDESLKAAKLLNEEGINAYVINVSTIKPLKDPLICDIVNECKYFITAENHSVIGGLGDAITSFLNENKVQYFHSKVGLNNVFAEGASTDYLMKKYQMNFESIYKTSIDLIK